MAKKLDRLYIRTDAMFHRDERYLAMPYALRDSAYALFQLLNGWSRDKQTDGRVPLAAAVSTGLAMEHPRSKVARMVEALCAVGLLARDGDELVIPKYGKWQDTAEEIERFSAAGRAGGKASGASRNGSSAERLPNGSFSAEPTDRSASVDDSLDDRQRSANDRSSQTETETETSTTRLRPVVPPDPPPNRSFDEADGGFGPGYEAFLTELRLATGRGFRGDAVSRELYAQRRRDGRSAAELEAAARGVVKSSHHMGLNKLQAPLNDPRHVLESAMLDTLIGWGTGEIGLVRVESDAERREREWAEAGQRRGSNLELQA